jgi:endonuclease/exonuclease/phosphatase (EEP) superfamily protein YafD
VVDAAALSWRALPLLLLAWVAAALVLRLTVRDRPPILSVLFYLTPLIVSAALSGVSALIWLGSRSWRLSGVAGSVAATFLVWWHVTTYSHHPPSPDPAGERIVFWNAARGAGGWSSLMETLQGFQADLIGLVEAGPRRGETEQFWRDRFPAHQVSGPKRGLVLLVRGTILEESAGKLGAGGRYGHYRVSLDGRFFDVLLVDVKSNPLRSRREAFEYLVRLIDDLSGRPLIVMGDFNTPVDSAFVAPLAKRLTNAFQACGNGYNVTWPLPLPVLSLDQVWASPEVKLRDCELRWTWRSDHRPVVVTLSGSSRADHSGAPIPK